MSDRPDGRLPDFLVVGAMRAGTTSLYRYLDAHPEISMAPKELQYFTEHRHRGLDWYRAQFAALTPARVLGEATADYLARESAMRHIAQALPAARLVASLRHPVSRTWSHFGLLSERGRDDRTFDEALDHEMEAIRRHGHGADGVIYLSHSHYDVHLERAFRLFGRDQVHVSIFERMKAEPRSTYRDLCDFVGVDPTFVPRDLGRQVNPYVMFRSLRVRRLAQRLPGGVGKVVARLNTRTVPPPAMPSTTRERLEAYFAPVISEVERLLGTAIVEWREPED